MSAAAQAEETRAVEPKFYSDFPIDLIDASPKNNRNFELEQNIAGLAASIKAEGLLQPVRGRPSPTAHGRVELILGERRLRASKAAGLTTIRIEVVEADGAHAHTQTIIENLHREDLSPLEQAEGVRALLDTYEGDVSAVAAQIGQTERWVRLRAKLADLSPAWREAIVKHDTLGRFGIGHLELIARHPQNVQDKILEDKTGWTNWLPTVAEVRNTCNIYLCLLSRAPFDLNESYGLGATCATCHKRTDQQLQRGLFDEPEEGELIDVNARCLDPDCYDARVKAFLPIRFAELKKERPGINCVVDGWLNDSQVEELEAAYGDVLVMDDHCEVYDAEFHKDENPIGAFVVYGEDAGRVVQVVRFQNEDLENDDISSGDEHGHEDSEEVQVQKAWQQTLNYYAGLELDDDVVYGLTDSALYCLALMYGCGSINEDDWEFFDKWIDGDKDGNVRHVFEVAVCERALNSLRAWCWENVNEDDIASARRICKLLGYDIDATQAGHLEEIKNPHETEGEGEA